MGLDITAYSDRKMVDGIMSYDEYERRPDYDDTVLVYENVREFRRHMEPMTPGVYSYSAKHHWRAGSYSSYNRWRADVCKVLWPRAMDLLTFID